MWKKAKDKARIQAQENNCRGLEKVKTVLSAENDADRERIITYIDNEIEIGFIPLILKIPPEFRPLSCHRRYHP